MSCGCNNNGYGGCGCGNYNTVQYAPSACNPNFPTSCTALGTGTIQRVVGEDSAYCKYTVPTLSSNSILFYNASTGLVNWGDASSSNPVFLGNGSAQATASSNVKIQGTTPTGQLVAFTPSTSTEAQIPVVSPSGTSVNWSTIESIIPNQGLVYKTGSVADGSLDANTVYQLTGNNSQIVSFDTAGNPVAVSGTTFGSAVPSGAIMPFAYNITSGNIPSGWLLCDGSTYTVTTYPTLGALLANTYGGSTGTFAVPNLKGLFIRGSGSQTSGGVTYTSGSIGTIQQDQIQGHYHSVTSTAIQGAGPGGAVGNPGGNFGAATITIGDPTSDASNGTVRFGTETRSVSLAMVYCIKT